MYTLDTEGPVSIVVYDLNSDVVKVLLQENQSAGVHTVSWDGRNDNGKIVTRGVYFVRIRAPGIFNQIRKVLIIK
jgi:flagellar hook assembly protein FlgD